MRSLGRGGTSQAPSELIPSFDYLYFILSLLETFRMCVVIHLLSAQPSSSTTMLKISFSSSAFISQYDVSPHPHPRHPDLPPPAPPCLTISTEMSEPLRSYTAVSRAFVFIEAALLTLLFPASFARLPLRYLRRAHHSHCP